MSSSDWLFINQVLHSDIFVPSSHFELISFLKSNTRPISIAGGQFSSGGQTLIDHGTIISLKKLNNISDINMSEKQYTVESGTTWKDVLNTLSHYDLVPLEMQSYNSFTVGGSVSVNAHSRMSGRISDSIVWIDVITSSGEILRCSPFINSKLFYSVIGGYGLVAIIWKIRLKTQSNKMLICRVYPHNNNQTLSEEIRYFADFLFSNSEIKRPSLYNCEISNLRQIYHIVWDSEDQNESIHTSTTLTQSESSFSQFFCRFGENIMALIGPAHDWYQAYHPYQINGAKNPLSYEMGYNAKDLIPLTPFRILQSLLQEYFLPLENLDKFIENLFQLVANYRVNLLNLSIRLVHFSEPSCYLDWANFASNQEKTIINKIAIVLYINVFNFVEGELAYREFTRNVIQIALDLGGTWYLPYYPAFTFEQLIRAYPYLPKFINIKRKYDPKNKLTSKFWQYIQNTISSDSHS
jgi:FAD/FMN-containing dehydrogenase